MENQQTKHKPKVRDPQLPTPYGGKPPERERLRDMLVVFVFYPITPTKHIEEVADRKPWLEFLSLLLKVALAAYAIYESATSGGGDF